MEQYAGNSPRNERRVGIAILAVAGLGVAGLLWAVFNGAFDQKPADAVRTYLDARARGDAATVWKYTAHSSGPGLALSVGNGSQELFEDRSLQAMLDLPENRRTGYRITSVTAEGGSNYAVAVAYDRGQPATETFSVVRWGGGGAFHPWGIWVDPATLTLDLAGSTQVVWIDGRAVPFTPSIFRPSSPYTVRTFPGYHTVALLPSDLVDSPTLDVYLPEQGVAVNPGWSLKPALRAGAAAALAAAFQPCLRDREPPSCPNQPVVGFLGGEIDNVWTVSTPPTIESVTPENGVEALSIRGVWTMKHSYRGATFLSISPPTITEQEHGIYCATLVWDGRRFTATDLRACPPAQPIA